MAKAVAELPTSVLISEEQTPVPVVAVAPISASVTKGQGTTMAPNTTEEGDRVTAGQRHISRVWEYTQAMIAFIVTLSTVFTLSMLALSKTEPTPNSLIMAGQLVVMDTLILTFYYARTNHTAIGGVGPKADEYRGR
jgi:hypothetical protein